MMTVSFKNLQHKWETKEDGEKLAQEIEKIGICETLELSGNTLGIDAARPIAQALEMHPELKVTLIFYGLEYIFSMQDGATCLLAVRKSKYQSP